MPDFLIPFDRLPERFADAVRNPTGAPVTPRPAATIVLLRDGDAGPEVLLLKRNRSAGFVPGAYVFPGGTVDRHDAAEAAVGLVAGLDDDGAARRLGLPEGDPPAMAYYLAALREAFEETGILVAHTPEGTTPPTAAADPVMERLRNDLLDDRVTFADLLDALGCRLDGAAVEYLAHWITPEPEPRRYDTRFFAARVPRGTRPVVDPREMTDALWVTPAGALRRNREGTLPMVFPTIRTLEQISAFGAVDELLADLRVRSIPAIMPRLVVTPTGIGMEVDP